MRKEKLSIKNIKTDLHNEMKNSYSRIIVFTLLFAAISAIVLAISTAKQSNVILVMYQVLFIVLAAVVFYFAVNQTVDIIKLHRIFRNTDCIVKDKLVGMEIKEYYSRIQVVNELYHLNFSGYGEYIIPDENYKWSCNFAMSARGVYKYSNCGDEFYLVLSKPHTGKILLAYNTKMFELAN